MARILIFQHVAHEILGTLDPLLRSYGARLRYVNFERDPAAQPRVQGYDGLIVLGGPMNMGELTAHPHLAHERKAIEEAIRLGVPVLGICLGSQLVAAALGAAVYPAPEKEIGWYPVERLPAASSDPVLGPFAGTETVFQWHGDTFDLPEGACELARSATGAPQAFRYGTNVYALQFHLEVDAAMIERWLDVPENRKAIAATGGAIDPDRIRREIPQYIERLEFLSERCFAGFIGLFGTLRRRSRQPH